MEARIEFIDKKIQRSISSRYSDTKESYQIALQILEDSVEVSYNHGIIYGKLLVALTNFIRAKDEHVFEFLMDAYEYFQQNPKEIGFLLTLDVLGSYYDNDGDYEKALSYLNEGILASKNIDFKEGEADILSSLGKVYMRLNNYDKAIQSFTSSLKIREEKELKQAQASALNLLGRVHTLKGLYEDAAAYYEQSISIRKEIDDHYGIVWSFIGLASMYETKGEPNKSIMYYKKALDSNENVNDLRLEFQISKGLGTIYLLQSDYDLAKDQIVPLVEMAEKINSKPLIYQAYKLLACYYEKINEFEKAYKCYKKHTELKDEVINTTTQNRIAHKQAEFEIINAKKEAEIYQLKNVELKEAYDKIEEKNIEITDSIKYALRIQKALLPDSHFLKNFINDFFIFYKPKDIISGDFYWFGEKENKLIFVAADCTGHGVPGALLSMLGMSFLTEIVNSNKDIKANEVLELLRDQIIKSLKQSGQEGESKDGMDIALCIFDKENSILQYSGAYNSLYLVRNSEIVEYKANRMPIGFHHKIGEPYTNHTIKLVKDEVLYLFSDGFPDQFGGTEGKKYKYKPFKDFLLSINHLSMDEQNKMLTQEFENWKGDCDQLDDVIVLGIKI